MFISSSTLASNFKSKPDHVCHLSEITKGQDLCRFQFLPWPIRVEAGGRKLKRREAWFLLGFYKLIKWMVMRELPPLDPPNAGDIDSLLNVIIDHISLMVTIDLSGLLDRIDSSFWFFGSLILEPQLQKARLSSSRIRFEIYRDSIHHQRSLMQKILWAFTRKRGSSQAVPYGCCFSVFFYSFRK